jgi:hypothetical protein
MWRIAVPAAKPLALVTRHDTNEDIAARKEAEAAMRPTTELSGRVPVALHGHKLAQRVWKRMISIYEEMDAQIVSKLDEDMLVDYCLVMEELVDLDRLHLLSMSVFEQLDERVRDLYSGTDELMPLLKQLTLLLKEIKSIDARSDRKRTFLHKLRQSLYLTPRSRAGVTPDGKAPEEAADPMEALLNP